MPRQRGLPSKFASWLKTKMTTNLLKSQIKLRSACQNGRFPPPFHVFFKGLLATSKASTWCGYFCPSVAIESWLLTKEIKLIDRTVVGDSTRIYKLLPGQMQMSKLSYVSNDLVCRHLSLSPSLIMLFIIFIRTVNDADNYIFPSTNH